MFRRSKKSGLQPRVIDGHRWSPLIKKPTTIKRANQIAERERNKGSRVRVIKFSDGYVPYKRGIDVRLLPWL